MTLGILIASFILCALFQFLRGRAQKKRAKLCTLLSIVFGWVFITQLLPMLFGKGETKALHVSIAPDRLMLGGLSISQTIVTAWVVMAVLLLLALIVRLFVIPKFRDVPRGLQNALEIALETIEKYTREKTEGHLGGGLSCYLFALTLFMVGCAAAELMGSRAPTADITMTFALALVTFFLINYFGIRKKGMAGRVKSMMQPVAVVLPFKLISDIAIPISMACRLFGNMLGGMVVMDLLYSALSSNAIGIPSVFGLYFNLFHPLIQAYIFVTLTLTFINEAIE